jgi:hypothetical protein
MRGIVSTREVRSTSMIGQRGRHLLPPLTVYVLLSLVSASFLAIGGRSQVQVLDDEPGYHSSTPMPASPGYWGVLTNWDGQWFRSIAETGYPVPLPMEDGVVAQNEWAFLPLYPLLVRAVMAVTSLPFPVAAWFLSISFGAVAIVLLYRLVITRIGAFGAGALVACICAYPTASLFQVGYPESLSLLLVVSALYALGERRYALVMLAALGLALTRPIVLPLAIVVAVHGLARLRSERESFRVRDRWLVATTATVTAALLGLWPAVADIVTGHRNTYLDTLAAWPVNQRSDGVLGGWFASILSGGPIGLTALAGLIWVVFLAVRQAAARWGVEVRTWALVYPLYLLAATRPSPSIFRYFMLSIAPMWPFLKTPSLAILRRLGPKLMWALLVLVLAVELPLQYVWTTSVYTFSTSPAEVWFP